MLRPLPRLRPPPLLNSRPGSRPAPAGADRKFKLIHLPRPKGGQAENYLKPSQFISITSTSKHPKEAAMFIDFMTNDVEANKFLLGERGVPISGSSAARCGSR